MVETTQILTCISAELEKARNETGQDISVTFAFSPLKTNLIMTIKTIPITPMEKQYALNCAITEQELFDMEMQEENWVEIMFDKFQQSLKKGEENEIKN